MSPGPPGVNAPPSPDDFARLIARVEALERRAGAHVVANLYELEDVDADQAADTNILIYDATRELWVPGTASAGLPIINDDGTYTQSLIDSSHQLIIANTKDIGAVLQSRIILANDGTFYIEARDQIQITSYLGAIKDVELLAGNGGNWTAASRVQSNGSSYSNAFLSAKNGGQAHIVEINIGLAYSQPTFHVGSSSGANPISSLFTKMTAAAATANLGSSDFTFWLDNTPGATAINFKAKDSAGTVRTGSIPLT